MNDEEAITVEDQLTVVRQWTDYMQSCVDKESLSYAEIIEAQAVYEIIKNNIY